MHSSEGILVLLSDMEEGNENLQPINLNILLLKIM